MGARRARGAKPSRAIHESLERRALLSAQPVGEEFRLNQHTTSSQIGSAAAMDNLGNFVVVWQSAGQDGNGDGVFARRYDAAGMPLGDEFQVNQHTTGNQQTPTVAMDDDGDFVVAWNSVGQEGVSGEIWARRYSSAGTAVGDEFHVNELTAFGQTSPAAAMDGAGNFIITWTGAPVATYDIYARRYNASGTALGGEFIVNTATPSSQLAPAVAMDADGDIVIAWQSFVGDDVEEGIGIFARRFDQAGMPAGDEFKVNQVTTNNQSAPAVATDTLGNFIIVWESNLQDGSGYAVMARRFTSSGGVMADEFQVNTTTSESQRVPSVAMDDSGDFTVTWASRLQDGSAYGIYAQCYDAAGNRVGNEFRVNTFTTASQFSPAIGMDSDGDFLITWNGDQQDGSGFGIFGQRFAPGDTSGPRVLTSEFVWQNAPQRIEYDFDQDVSASLDAADIQIVNTTTMQPIPVANILVTWDAITMTARFTFPGYSFGALPDAFYQATLVAAGVTNGTGAPLIADEITDFKFLMADADQNGIVNLADFNKLAAGFGLSPRDFTEGDFSYNGLVNLQDFNLLATQFGMSLSPSTSSASSASRGFTSDSNDDESERVINVVG